VSGRHWTEAETDELMRLYPDTPTAELAARLGCTHSQIYNKAERLGLKKSAEYMAGPHACRLRRDNNPGVNTRFTPGHVAWNKGMKGLDIGGKETRFKRGNLPHNHNPIWHERLTREGYLERKITDTGCTRRDYVPLHVLLWREHQGEIPKNHVVTFRNKDKTDLRIENLECISRMELMRRNSVHNYPEPLRKLIQLRGVLNRKISQQEKGNAKND